MRRFFTILILIGIISSPAMSQENEEWYLDKPIADFTFIDLVTVSLSEIRPIVRQYIGLPFTYDVFYEVQDRLLMLDYFDEISANAVPADEEKSAVIIEFRVKERPTIAEIVVTGNANISKASILDKVLLKRGDFVSRSEVNLDAENIRQLYLGKGFPEVAVDGEIDLDEEKNEVTVTFRVDEGKETKIREIIFSGNSYASDSTLRRVMKTKGQSVFSTGSYRENLLELDKSLIEEYYQKNGFLDAEVVNIEQQEEYDEDSNQLFIIITIYVEEGSQYSYGGMTFEGNEVFEDAQVEELIRMKTGGVLNMQKVETSYQKIIGLYLDNGYLENEFTRKIIRDEENKIISFHIVIVEKSKSHIENIIIQGNEKTKDYVILRELPFEEGDIFSRGKLYEGWRNLYNLQYFSTVDILPVRGTSGGLVDYIITVEEQSWADFRFAFSFSGLDFPISGSFGWSDKNFLGTGRAIGFDLEASTVRQGLSATFQDNYLFGKDFGGGLSLSVFHNVVKNVYQDIVPPIFTDVDVPDPYTSLAEYEAALANGIDIPLASTMDYDSIDISFSVNSGYFYRSALGRLGVQTGLSITATYLWYDPALYRPYNKTVRDNLENLNFINTWGTTFYWDNRDIYYNPTEGFYVSQYVGFTGGFLFGSRDYISLKSRADGFLTLWSVPAGENFDFETVLAVHSAVSFITPTIGGLEVTSSQDLLAIDGITVARGWPFVSAYRALWESSLELRSPIIRQYLWWSWFLDAAGAWTEISQMGSMSLNDFHFSIGGGLRLTLPGFPIRFYLAQTFSFQDGKLLWGDGDIDIGNNLSLKFVLAFTRPGGF
jgi:outer membrane protein insertion porin family